MAEETKPAEGSQPKEQVVDPWHVEAAEGEDKIDYDKLISKCQLIAFIHHRLVIFLRLSLAASATWFPMQSSLVVRGLPQRYWRE